VLDIKSLKARHEETKEILRVLQTENDPEIQALIGQVAEQVTLHAIA
jgi:hypothetical protein